MATKQEWKKRFEEQRRSGLSIAAWCKQQGIRENQYHYWRRKVETSEVEADAGCFVRIGGGDGVELLVGERIRVKVPTEFDSSTLKRLLEVLGC